MRKRLIIMVVLLGLLLGGCKKNDKGEIDPPNDIENPSNGNESPKDQGGNDVKKEENMIINIAVEDQKPVYRENGNIISENANLKKGYIIKFTYGNLEGFMVGDGFRTLKETDNLFVVEKADDLSVSVEIKGTWHKFNFTLEGSQSSIEFGQFTRDDLVLKLGDNYFDMNDKPSQLVKLLPGGESIVHDIEVEDPNIKMVEYKKDGITIYYYDNPKDNGFNSFIEMITVESPNYPTNRGLKIGDNYEKMIELYGEYSHYNEYENQAYYYYSTDEMEEHRIFTITFDRDTNKMIRYYVSSSL